MQCLSSFIAFLCKLFEDSNFKISLACLNITSQLLISPDLLNSSNLSPLISCCVWKLGDNKISVRLSAHKIFRQLIYYDIEISMNELVMALDNNTN